MANLLRFAHHDVCTVCGKLRHVCCNDYYTTQHAFPGEHVDARCAECCHHPIYAEGREDFHADGCN